MRSRYLLAPEAALDLVQIWRFIRNNASLEMADRVESVIREKMAYLAGRPDGGHWRKDLTDEQVKFFTIYSYLIVYRPETPPCRSSPFSMAAATWNWCSRIAYEPQHPYYVYAAK
jgi:plasmid stabilization system protein ParE